MGIFVSACGNMGVAYNFGVIDLALHNMVAAYPQAPWVVSAVPSSTFAGAVVGQLCLGYLGDRIGRRLAMLVTLVLASGSGGVYPLSAVAGAESARAGENREQRSALGFMWQAAGAVLAPLVAFVVLRVSSDPRVAWRIFLIVGMLPALVVVRATYLSEESSEFRAVAAQQRPSLVAQLGTLLKPAYASRLLGCALSWFLFDIAFYGLWIFMPSILSDIVPRQGHSQPACSAVGTMTSAAPAATEETGAYQARIAGYTAAINCLGIPSMLLSVYLIGDRMGAKQMQMIGFALMAITQGVLGGIYEPLRCQDDALLTAFCVTFVFLNFGTGVTTYLMPQRLFPADVRSTANGLSAAAGKLGSFIATATFKPLMNAAGLSAVFFACCIVSALGFLVTCLAIPSGPALPTELSQEMPPGSARVGAGSALFARGGSDTDGELPGHKRRPSTGHLRAVAKARAEELGNVHGVTASL
eukprot:g1851.t1